MSLLRRLDRFCARLNAGIAAVAIALGLLLLAVATVQTGNYAMTQGLGVESFLLPY